jgi:hypothetical protein
MSWFGKGSLKHILKHAEYSTILAAEVNGGRIAKLLYTGHDGASSKGAVQAVEPGGGALWHAAFAEENDVSEGHVAVAGDVVVTRVGQGRKHVLVAHGMWTGDEKWKLPVGQMVSRMGVDQATGELVFVTFDHVVHAIDMRTGQDRPRPPVMTDGARNQLINALGWPHAQISRTSSSSSSQAEWSYIYRPAPGIEVRERDWAGTTEFAVQDHLIGSGSYEGAMLVGPVLVVAFKLDRDEGRHHHWYLFELASSHLLGILREDGSSEFFSGGASVWKGKL